MIRLTYSIAKNIEWPEKSTPFKIHVITTDEALKSEFRKTSQSQKIDGRNVEVTFTSYVMVPQGADAIMVTNRYNSTIPSLLDRIGGTPTLLFTDRYDKQRDVMVNILDKSSEALTFEINRANVTNQGLIIKSEMRSLGGSEVDLAKIFKQVRDSVRAMELRAQELKVVFDSLNFATTVSRRLFREQDRIIQDRNDEIAFKQSQIDDQNSILDSLREEFAESEKKLIALTSQLDNREKQLAVLSEEISLQADKVEEGNKTLAEQQERIAAQNEEIAQREQRLDEMSTVVNSQQSALVFLILFLVVVVVFLFLIFTAYRARKRAAKKLAEQKEDLARLLDELQDTQSQLVQSEKMASLGVLTAGIAHEINNAINFVYSGIHVLSDKFSEIRPVISHVTELDEDDKNLKKSIKELVQEREDVSYDEAQGVIDQMITSIKVGAERTTEIVKGLRIFSRSETEKKTNIDIHNDLDVALLLLNSRHKDAVKINKHFADQIPEIQGFKGQLSQAFLNIISNSIDSVNQKGKGGEIDIFTSKNGASVEVKIKDNGVGMSEVDRQKIFDPFFTTKKVGAGTGLGLSITYGIIERHGGTIVVHSKLDEGAEFIIKLPLES
ncbi:His Kinase A (phospho-acceptor) domain-containing protein [Ekhidna lutea]|uniref:histidine kinase n=2 Tax=Ekhidna lutea TaxID=447679 RepID=A0A239MBE6_EKHLU|nr:His Kinase A (phospho-acceptor) domain-containing protein [Ekhidna lutea]